MPTRALCAGSVIIFDYCPDQLTLEQRELLSHGQRRRFHMARFAARFAKRLSPRQRLWLFAWQRQKAVVAGPNGFAGLDWIL